MFVNVVFTLCNLQKETVYNIGKTKQTAILFLFPYYEDQMKY